MADRGSSHKQRVAQGDSLMPLLFSIGTHGALEEVASSMEHGEQLCAFLHDVHVLRAPHQVVPLFKQLSESLERVAGIRLHHGKTRVWNTGGIPPEDVLERGRDVWQPHGLKVLRVGDEIGNPLRCRCILGIVGGRPVGQRNPEVAEMVVRTMEGEQQFPEGGCKAELQQRPRRFLVETRVARTPPQEETTRKHHR